MRRRIKQFVYGTFYTIVLVGILLSAYFSLIRPAPTCFDGKQNQGEEGIDCGGVCGNYCIVSPVPLGTPSAVRVLPISSGEGASPRFTLLAEVENRNEAYGALAFSYTFETYDASGGLLGTFSGTSFIYPREVKYVVATALEVAGGTLPSRATLSITGTEWVPTSALRPARLIVRDARTEVGEAAVEVQGVVVNDDTVPLPRIGIVAVFYDLQGRIVGASKTELVRVGPRETRSFGVFHPLIPSIDPGRTRIFPEAVLEQ